MAKITIKGKVQIHLNAEEMRMISGSFGGGSTGTIHAKDVPAAIKTLLLQAAASKPPASGTVAQMPSEAGNVIFWNLR